MAQNNATQMSKSVLLLLPPSSPLFPLTMVALIQRPAPAFNAAAIVDGLFEDVSLTDYLGQWYEPFSPIPGAMTNYS